ncbi:hypothetical protein TWF506_010457 [Arthrobotrys conoides]|uniref:MYND-type domain-containing protein n=1 Tax=Arthrobotrys conoides TaxID=74498 RepID=A0AAN8NB25_9PEZI
MEIRTRLVGNECIVCGRATEGCCKKCRSVFYCNERHRQYHAEEHNEACLEVQSAKQNLKEAEEEFNQNQNFPGYGDLKGMIASIRKGNAPSLQKKCFCSWTCTPVMVARSNLIGAYLQINNKLSVTNACNVAITTQYLGRCDPMKIRSITANLMVRIGGQQNAYDFIKYWLVNSDQYDCTAKKPKPFIDIRKADAFEPCKDLFGAFENADIDPPASLLVPLALVKLKLLKAVERLRNLQILRCKLPFDIIYLMKPSFRSNDIMKNRRDIRLIDTVAGYEKLIKSLEDDLHLLFEVVGRAFEGKYVVWRCFFESDYVRRTKRYSQGVRSIYKYSADAWMETKGAYEWILEKLDDASHKKLTAENRVQDASRVAALFKAVRSQLADRGSDEEEDYEEYFGEEEDYAEFYCVEEGDGNSESDHETDHKTRRNFGIRNGCKIDYDLMYREIPPKMVFDSLVDTSFGFGSC